MLSKLNTKTLVVLLIAMIAVFAALYYTDNTDSSFKSEIINIDTSKVSRIKLTIPSNEENKSFELIKENNKWHIVDNGKKVAADADKIKALLVHNSPLKTIRVASNSKKQWEKYGVGDKGAKIEFYDDNNLLAGLVLGKVDYQAPQQDAENPYMRGNQGIMICYARVKGDNDVYVVDGYLKLTFAGDIKSYRKKTVINVKPDQVNEVSIKSGKASFDVKKAGNKWMVDNIQADSANTLKYVNNISRLNGYDFFNEDVIKGIEPVGTAFIKTLNDDEIVVDAYVVDSANFAFVSSQNKGNIIKDKNGKIFDRLFKNKNYFLGKESK
jgi:hypothetical protein